MKICCDLKRYNDFFYKHDFSGYEFVLKHEGRTRIDPKWCSDYPLWVVTLDICRNIMGEIAFVHLRMLSSNRTTFSDISVVITTYILICTKRTTFYLSRNRKEPLSFSVIFYRLLNNGTFLHSLIFFKTFLKRCIKSKKLKWNIFRNFLTDKFDAIWYFILPIMVKGGSPFNALKSVIFKKCF